MRTPQLIKKGLRQCYRCKRILPLGNRHFDKSNKKGHSGFRYLCKDCKKKWAKNYYQRELSHDPRKLFDKYKRSAKQRHYSFGLTFEQFKTFWQKDCYYCGDQTKTIGLDRVDNSKGYNLDNIVSCCWKCNQMKLALSQKEFISQCKKIAREM